jgi:hypothetical protein
MTISDQVGAVPPSATPVDAPPVADLPTSVWGIASDRVARVELRVDGGATFDGELYAIPPGPSTRSRRSCSSCQSRDR